MIQLKDKVKVIDKYNDYCGKTGTVTDIVETKGCEAKLVLVKFDDNELFFHINWIEKTDG